MKKIGNTKSKIKLFKVNLKKAKCFSLWNNSSPGTEKENNFSLAMKAVILRMQTTKTELGVS